MTQNLHNTGSGTTTAGELAASGEAGKRQPYLMSKLVDKHSSPMVIRKWTRFGFPLYVGLICDDDLSDLDVVLRDFMFEARDAGLWTENLQKLRNLTGALSERISEHYPSIEGVAITLYADKFYVQSLFGDFMNHGSCKAEYSAALGLMAHI